MFEQILHRIAEALDRNHISYMVIGGQAILIYGIVRSTRDIDITVGVGTDKLADMLDICRQTGLDVLCENPEDFARDTMVLPAIDSKSRVRIDFMFSFSRYEETALKRAETKNRDGYPVKFASLEDIIVHKVVSGRAVDMEDIRGLLAKSEKAVDFSYIRQWLLEIMQIPGCEGVLQRFDELLESEKKDQ